VRRLSPSAMRSHIASASAWLNFVGLPVFTSLSDMMFPFAGLSGRND
jgi:hypothetical protein